MSVNILSIIIITLLTSNGVGGSESWIGWSLNDNNDRYRRDPIPVTLPATKTEFKQLWYTKLDGPVMVTPTVYQNHVYVPTSTGTIYCLQADNGNIVWQRNLLSIINNSHPYASRNSPLVYKDMIIFGVTDLSLLADTPGYGSYAVALDSLTGTLRWKTLVASHPMSVLTNSPQLANDRLFIGISSQEARFAANPTYPCCSFQGSVVALEATTGKLIWETKMVPDNHGSTTEYSGKLKGKIGRFLLCITNSSQMS